MMGLAYHQDMATDYAQTGRINQKSRTRSQLIAAARSLVAQGGSTPTVEEVAAAASVSRTTAYRYFPSQRSLLAVAHPETETTSLLPENVGNDPEVRLMVAVDAFIKLIIDTEQQQRTMLRMSLEPATDPDGLPLRKGRAIGWFEDALGILAPRFTEAEVRRLSIAVRSAVGIESLVWLIDIAGYSREEAARLMRWSARSLLRQALLDGLPRDL